MALSPHEILHTEKFSSEQLKKRTDDYEKQLDEHLRALKITSHDRLKKIVVPFSKFRRYRDMGPSIRDVAELLADRYVEADWKVEVDYRLNEFTMTAAEIIIDK